MPIVSSEHDETSSRVRILSTEQVCTISRSSTFAGVVHLQAYERVMIRDLPIFTLGAETSNKLIGWVDSDFGSDPDTRKSMTGYLMPLNGCAISWKLSRHGGVTLRSSKAEFVSASQAGQEVVDLLVFLKGFSYIQKKPTVLLEDYASACIMKILLIVRPRSKTCQMNVLSVFLPPVFPLFWFSSSGDLE